MISILIPAYKESDLLETLLNQLIKDPYKNKEIITVIDEPTEKSKQLVKKYETDCTFILNDTRLGKTTALNNVAKMAKGSLLVFLDADTTIKTHDFLSKVVTDMDVDMMEFKKEVLKENLISRLVNYDYMGGMVCSMMFNKLKKCLGLNGSGFVITRQFFNEIGGFKPVISEDLEMGMQVYLKNKTYKYAKDIIIYQKAPSTWKAWFNQRKRWSIGTAQFAKTHKKDFAKAMVEHPKMIVVALYFFFPALISALLMTPFAGQAILLFLFALTLKFPVLLPILFLTAWGILLFKNLTIFALMYAVSSVLFYITSKKLQLKYSNKEFLIYYLFYSPMWFMLFISYFITVMFKKNLQLQDWKV